VARPSHLVDVASSSARLITFAGLPDNATPGTDVVRPTARSLTYTVTCRHLGGLSIRGAKEWLPYHALPRGRH
jgi:hypothetical protein